MSTSAPSASPTLRARNAARLIAQAEAAAVARPFDAIPEIDIAGLISGDDAEASRVAEEIRTACIEVGFFYISGHGVDPAFIEATFAQAHRFFALPSEAKQAISILNSDKLRGYTGVLEENTDPDNVGDLHEAFDIGLDLDADDPDVARNIYGYGVNQWPDLDGFREQVVGYHTAMRTLCDALYRGFALSLGLDGDFFVERMAKPISELRLLRYPAQPEPEDGVLGIGAHSDYDMFTVLATDDVPALELLNPAGEWVKAPPVANSFIVNVGDLLQRMTNDLYRSTMHRAVNANERDRYSLPYFSNIDPHQIVEVLPSCTSDDRPARYEPIGAAEYVEACMLDSYGYND